MKIRHGTEGVKCLCDGRVDMRLTSVCGVMGSSPLCFMSRVHTTVCHLSRFELLICSFKILCVYVGFHTNCNKCIGLTKLGGPYTVCHEGNRIRFGERWIKTNTRSLLHGLLIWMRRMAWTELSLAVWKLLILWYGNQSCLVNDNCKQTLRHCCINGSIQRWTNET